MLAEAPTIYRTGLVDCYWLPLDPSPRHAESQMGNKRVMELGRMIFSGLPFDPQWILRYPRNPIFDDPSNQIPGVKCPTGWDHQVLCMY